MLFILELSNSITEIDLNFDTHFDWKLKIKILFNSKELEKVNKRIKANEEYNTVSDVIGFLF